MAGGTNGGDWLRPGTVTGQQLGFQGCCQQVVYSLTPLGQIHLVLVCFHSNAILFLWHGHPGSLVGQLELEVDGGLDGRDWVARC